MYENHFDTTKMCGLTFARANDSDSSFFCTTSVFIRVSYYIIVPVFYDSNNCMILIIKKFNKKMNFNHINFIFSGKIYIMSQEISTLKNRFLLIRKVVHCSIYVDSFSGVPANQFPTLIFNHAMYNTQ